MSITIAHRAKANANYAKLLKSMPVIGKGITICFK